MRVCGLECVSLQGQNILKRWKDEKKDLLEDTFLILRVKVLFFLYIDNVTQLGWA